MIDLKHNFFAKIQNSKNFVIVRDDIGKAKPFTRKLPDAGFVFGKKVNRDKESAGDLIGSWTEHKKSVGSPCERNYKFLNILSLASKKTRASEVREFRKKQKLCEKVLKKYRNNTPDIRFGLAVRPSTPMRAIITNFYGELATQTKHSQYAEAKKATETLLEKYRKEISTAKGTRLRRSSIG